MNKHPTHHFLIFNITDVDSSVTVRTEDSTSRKPLAIYGSILL